MAIIKAPTVGVTGVNSTESKPYNKIETFLAEVRRQGLAKPNRFEVIIDTPPCVKNMDWGKQVSLMCDSAFFPMHRLVTSRQQLFGLPEFFPVGVDQGGDNLGLNFLVDREMTVKKFFDAWLKAIVDNRTGLTSYQYTAAGEPIYQTFITIKQLDESDRVTYAVRLEASFPVAVNTMTLDHNLPNTSHKLNVTFNYRRWTPLTITASAAPLSDNITQVTEIMNGGGGVTGVNSMVPGGLTPQQQAQNVLQPGYNKVTEDTYYIVN